MKYLLFADNLLGWLYRRDVGVQCLDENGNLKRDVLQR